MTVRLTPTEDDGERPTDGPTPTLEGDPVTVEWRDWPAGALVRLGDTVLSVGPVEVVDRMLLRPPDSGQLDFNRPPRLLPPFLQTDFRIPKPPVAPQRSAIPWIMVFVPAMFGIVMATVFRSPFYLLFAAMTPMMVIGQTISSRRTGKKSHRKQLAEHRERVAALETAIDQAVLDQRDQRRTSCARRRVAAGRRDHPRSTAVGASALGRRPPARADRYGRPAVDRHRGGRPRPRRTRARTPGHPSVPVTVPLAEVGVLGIAGAGDSPRELGRWVLGQLAVTQSPREVQFVVLTAQQHVPAWAWTLWLPHMRPTGGQEALALIVPTGRRSGGAWPSSARCSRSAGPNGRRTA